MSEQIGFDLFQFSGSTGEKNRFPNLMQQNKTMKLTGATTPNATAPAAPEKLR